MPGHSWLEPWSHPPCSTVAQRVCLALIIAHSRRVPTTTKTTTTATTGTVSGYGCGYGYAAVSGYGYGPGRGRGLTGQLFWLFWLASSPARRCRRHCRIVCIRRPSDYQLFFCFIFAVVARVPFVNSVGFILGLKANSSASPALSWVIDNNAGPEQNQSIDMSLLLRIEFVSCSIVSVSISVNFCILFLPHFAGHTRRVSICLRHGFMAPWNIPNIYAGTT